MKNSLLTIPVLLLTGLLSCSRLTVPEGDSTLDVNWVETPTKGAATDAEKKVNSLCFYVFDAHGMLEISHPCTAEELADRRAGLNVKLGNKTVYAVANLSGAPLTAAGACLKAADLEAVAVDLADNSAAGFVMTAKGSVTVSAGTGASCSLNLARAVAKVSLGTVTNNLPSQYGALKVRHAFLCNVVGNQNLGGTASIGKWYNQNGTDVANGKKEATVGQGGHEAQLPDFTWKKYGTSGQNIALNGKYNFASGTVFYAFPNATTQIPAQTVRPSPNGR